MEKQSRNEPYQKMYYTLFHAITDALEQIERKDYGTAENTLIFAQQRAEEIYCSRSEYEIPTPVRGTGSE